MSEGHSLSNDNGAGEDHISISLNLQSEDSALEVALENTEDLQQQSKIIEALSSENPNQDRMAENSSSSVNSIRSHGLDWNVVAMSGLDEALSDISHAVSSLEETMNRKDKVIDALSNVEGSKPETEPASSSGDVFASSSAQASETDRNNEPSDAMGFISDNIPSSTHSEETQTAWISLDTPGSSLTDLQMEVPKELKPQSLDSKSLSLNFTTDSESEAFQKKFRSEESDVEDTETRSEESDFEGTEVNPSDSSERTESEESEIEEAGSARPLRDFQVAVVKTSNVVTCKFCKQVRMAFPTPQQLDTTNPEKLFCCNMSWELYQQILRNREENPDYEEPVSDQEGFHPTKLEVEEAVKKLAERVKNPEVTMYMTSVVHRDKVIFTGMKTISYRLSSEYCRKQGWTLRPPQAKTVTFEDLSQYVPSAQSYKEAERPHGIMEKYYPDGCKFVTIFPDGTGTVFYPSGNVSIVISAFHHEQLVYTIFEDLEWNAKMLGVFRSTGYGTCYLPSGQIWISVTPRCGLYFTEQGLLKKHWLWRDYQYHIHAPPYNSISLKLNPYISVQVISRDQIYTTFKTKTRSIRFNMGAKLVLRDLEQSHAAQSGSTEAEKYINKAKQQIHMLLEQMKQL